MQQWAEFVTRLIEGSGIIVIVVGLLFATGWFLQEVLVRRVAFEDIYPTYRRRIGQSILLGLELLVAADIIGTVAVEPTLMSVTVLGLIVLVRTFLSMALEIEMTGRLPWRRTAAQ